jgi:adenylylsulfate kinase
MNEGVLWWITGLAGSGKTTIAKALVENIESHRIPVVHFDGDVLRGIFKAEGRFDRSDRLDLAFRYGDLCRLVTQRGIDVVCSTMSLFNEVHARNRSEFSRYREVFLDVPRLILEQRDKKGLYSGARLGCVDNVVGVNSSVEFPKFPDLVLTNDGSETPEIIADRIYAIRPTGR